MFDYKQRPWSRPLTDEEYDRAVGRDLLHYGDRLKVGAKIRFAEEKQAYIVQACDGRFAVCTKPFNAKRTVLYTIVDLKEKVRGTENLVFSFGFETQRQCEEALGRLQSGETEVSHRNRIPLELAAV